MSFIIKLLAVTMFSGILNASNSTEYLGNIESGKYTSPEKTLVCNLPIFDTSEEFEENYVPSNEGISVLLNGESAYFSRTSMSIFKTDQAKYIKKSMTIKNKLLAIEKHWSETFVDIMDSSDTKKEFMTIGGIIYRLFITTGTIDNKVIMGSTAQLFTVDGSNIILYMVRNFDKTPHDEMEKSLMSLFGKCKYVPAT